MLHEADLMSTGGNRSPANVVRGFLDEVRSGRRTDHAHRYLAPSVLAHQLTGEHEMTIRRTPADYAEHVEDMMAKHGDFSLDILTFVASDDLVSVVWRQTGERHPTGSGDASPIIELAACTYRVDDDRIVEYWLLLDRLGIARQLDHPVGPAARRSARHGLSRRRSNREVPACGPPS